MSLVEPDRKDPYGLAGKRNQGPFAKQRIRRLGGPKLIPRWFTEGLKDFGASIWMSKPDYRAWKARRKR